MRRTLLGRAYEDAVYTADLPAGFVEFRIGKKPSGPAPNESLAIVTACNPGRQLFTDVDNRKANDRLAESLQTAGLAFHPTRACAPDGSHAESSFAVPGISPAAALDLARQFDQAAILFWDGDSARLLWCDAQA